MRGRLIAVVVLGACTGGSSGSRDGGPDVALAADAAGDALLDAPAADAPPSEPEGQVLVAEAQSFGFAYAMFAGGALFPVVGGTAGPCQGGGGVPDTSLDAGAITITGTASDLALAQSSPGSIYRPAEALLPPEVFDAGTTLTVTATGGTVPAFTGTVTAPEPIVDMVFPTMYSRAAPPALTWTAGSGDAMWIRIEGTGDDPPGILCRVPDTGTFQLTPAMLALLPASVTTVLAFAYRIHETTVTAGAWTVALRAADIQHQSLAVVVP